MVSLRKPAKGNETRGFSVTHRAIDFGWGGGTEVYAAAAGTLSHAWDALYGWRATIKHPDGTRTTYSHLAKVLKAGKVSQGEHIATMGNSGNMGIYNPALRYVHLHFEYIVDSVRVQPKFSSTEPAHGGTVTPLPEENKSTTRKKKIAWLG